jgi:hypothetical protein
MTSPAAAVLGACHGACSLVEHQALQRMQIEKAYKTMCMLLFCAGGQTIEDYDPVARRQQCKTGGVKGVDGAAASATKPAAGESPHHTALK